MDIDLLHLSCLRDPEGYMTQSQAHSAGTGQVHSFADLGMLSSWCQGLSSSFGPLLGPLLLDCGFWVCN